MAINLIYSNQLSHWFRPSWCRIRHLERVWGTQMEDAGEDHNSQEEQEIVPTYTYAEFRFDL